MPSRFPGPSGLFDLPTTIMENGVVVSTPKGAEVPRPIIPFRFFESPARSTAGVPLEGGAMLGAGDSGGSKTAAGDASNNGPKTTAGAIGVAGRSTLATQPIASASPQATIEINTVIFNPRFMGSKTNSAISPWQDFSGLVSLFFFGRRALHESSASPAFHA